MEQHTVPPPLPLEQPAACGQEVALGGSRIFGGGRSPDETICFKGSSSALGIRNVAHKKILK